MNDLRRKIGASDRVRWTLMVCLMLWGCIAYHALPLKASGRIPPQADMLFLSAGVWFACLALALLVGVFDTPREQGQLPQSSSADYQNNLAKPAQES